MLVRKRQRALMAGDMRKILVLRNKVNRSSRRLRQDFYQSQVASLEQNASKDWWKQMKRLMGTDSSGTSDLERLDNATCQGNMQQLTNQINDALVAATSELPRLADTHPARRAACRIQSRYRTRKQHYERSTPIKRLVLMASQHGF